MKILVVGAGGTGGYFGGRLAQAGADVTFLVRKPRAARLAAAGLVVTSPKGDFTIPSPTLLTEIPPEAAFDVVLLSCKAYDLESAIESFAPAIGPATLILPLLNGMRHLDLLDAKFGPAHVLGGQCIISAALGPEGQILHLNDADTITFGPRAPSQHAAAEAILAAFAPAFTAELSANIVQDMWEKWVIIASLAGLTCLMRANIGAIMAAGGEALARTLIAECSAIAEAHGHPPRPAIQQRMRAALTTPGSPLTASMLRDITAGNRIEAEQIIGNLLARAQTPSPLLTIIDVNLKAYEAMR